MYNRTFIATLLVLILALLSCKEDELVCPVGEETVEGLLRYSGSPAADGCGWLIEINSKSYSPVNLPAGYQKQEDQRVLVSYILLNDKFSCGLVPTQFDKIKLTEITPF